LKIITLLNFIAMARYLLAVYFVFLRCWFLFFFFVLGRGVSVKGYEKRAGMRFSARGGAHGLMALALV